MICSLCGTSIESGPSFHIPIDKTMRVILCEKCFSVDMLAAKCQYCDAVGRYRIDPAFKDFKMETVLCQRHYKERTDATLFNMPIPL